MRSSPARAGRSPSSRGWRSTHRAGFSGDTPARTTDHPGPPMDIGGLHPRTRRRNTSRAQMGIELFTHAVARQEKARADLQRSSGNRGTATVPNGTNLQCDREIAERIVMVCRSGNHRGITAPRRGCISSAGTGTPRDRKSFVPCPRPAETYGRGPTQRACARISPPKADGFVPEARGVGTHLHPSTEEIKRWKR